MNQAIGMIYWKSSGRIISSYTWVALNETKYGVPQDASKSGICRKTCCREEVVFPKIMYTPFGRI